MCLGPSGGTKKTKQNKTEFVLSSGVTVILVGEKGSPQMNKLLQVPVASTVTVATLGLLQV